MDLFAITPHLSPRRASMLSTAVYQLETGIQAQFVRNRDFVDAKDTINRAVEEASESFFKGTNGLWDEAYKADALLDGAHTLPTKLKRAQKAGMTSYAGFITTALLPLRELLEAAKPMIVKRQDQPKVKTAKQIADEADQMTCQCCGRGIFAATGVIAHHGYERPGDGYQTASCMGARHLPFEVSRVQLGLLIEAMKRVLAGRIIHRDEVATEDRAIKQSWKVGRFPKEETREFAFNRVNFDSEDGIAAKRAIGIYGDFDDLKARELDRRDRAIKSLSDDIAAQQARYDGWKQTHDRIGGKWVGA